MAEFSVSVVRVRAIEPIENADAIESVVIGDYRSIAQKGMYHPGDLVVYIPEDAIVPTAVLQRIGLEGKLTGKNKDRVKAIKLRGVLSQGILYPVLPHVPEKGISNAMVYVDEFGQTHHQVVQEGQNVADVLGITKYEPVIPACMSGEVYNAGKRLTVPFDVENLKKYPDVFVDGEEVVMTEKIHGCLHGDSKVMLPNGECVSISYVVSNTDITHVWSFDVSSGAYCIKPITGKMQRSNTEGKGWVRLTLENGNQLTVTHDHPVYSRDRSKYVPAGDLLYNEDIESPIS